MKLKQISGSLMREIEKVPLGKQILFVVAVAIVCHYASAIMHYIRLHDASSFSSPETLLFNVLKYSVVGFLGVWSRRPFMICLGFAGLLLLSVLFLGPSSSNISSFLLTAMRSSVMVILYGVLLSAALIDVATRAEHA